MKLNQSLNKSESRSSVSHQVYLNHSDTFKVAWFSTCKWSLCQQSNEQGYMGNISTVLNEHNVLIRL